MVDIMAGMRGYVIGVVGSTGWIVELRPQAERACGGREGRGIRAFWYSTMQDTNAFWSHRTRRHVPW